MNPAPDNLIDTVRKLLAKAESTDNANEAEIFSAKAAALIARHRLDVRQVQASLQRGDLGLRRFPLGRGAYVRARLSLLASVARHHDCEVVFETGNEGTTAVVAGYQDDLDITAVLYESLHVQAASQMAGVRRATPAATQRWRRSFLFGYAAKVDELFEVTRAAAAATSPTANSAEPPTLFDQASVPDLVARRDRVQDFAARSFGRVARARAAAPATASGWRGGQVAASNADLGRTRLAGRRALGPGRG